MLPEGGIDAVVDDGLACLRADGEPTAASALTIVVSPEHRGHDVSRHAISAMAEVVGRHGLADLTWSNPSRGSALVDGSPLGLEQRTALGSDGG
jgi:hypothetical protein